MEAANSAHSCFFSSDSRRKISSLRYSLALESPNVPNFDVWIVGLALPLVFLDSLHFKDDTGRFRFCHARTIGEIGPNGQIRSSAAGQKLVLCSEPSVIANSITCHHPAMIELLVTSITNEECTTILPVPPVTAYQAPPDSRNRSSSRHSPCPNSPRSPDKRRAPSPGAPARGC